jgi:hypothetical protein
VIALIVAALLPVAGIAFGCILLLGDTIFNLSFGITFVVIPLVAITFLALIIFSEWKTLAKSCFVILILLGFIPLFLTSTMYTHLEMMIYEQDDTIGESYREACDMFPTLPTMGELGSHTKAEHYEYVSAFGIFGDEADTLIVHYDTDEYQAQKAMLEEKFVFENDESEGVQYACELEGYSFRMLDTDFEGEYAHEVDYPQRVILIATNDQTKTIAYTAFRNDELDYITSLEEFLLRDCGWKYILK